MSKNRPESTRMDYSSNDNMYGAHLLVDFKPIYEADSVLEECKQFIDQVSSGILTLPFSIPSLKSWRLRRRDSRLLTMFETLHPRVIATEKVLRSIIGEVVEKKTALRAQAKYLQVRLKACIQYNTDVLSVSEDPVDDLRGYISKLSNESALLKSMIAFNKEMLRIRNIESVSKGKSFVRWGVKPSSKRTVSDADLANDRDHQLIQTRLEQLREVREKFVSSLAAILENRGSYMANLENCERSLEAITQLIQRGGDMGSASASASSSDDSHEPELKFDHSRCSDCSYGYSITCDCTNHLAALQKQALDANARLQALVEMREKMSEASEELLFNLNESESGPDGDGAGRDRFSLLYGQRGNDPTRRHGSLSQPALASSSAEDLKSDSAYDVSPRLLGMNSSSNEGLKEHAVES